MLPKIGIASGLIEHETASGRRPYSRGKFTVKATMIPDPAQAPEFSSLLRITRHHAKTNRLRPQWRQIETEPNTSAFKAELYNRALKEAIAMRYRDRNLDRRDFVRAIGVAALGAGPVIAGRRPLDPLSPGIKISLQIPGDFPEEDLVFAKQLGVEYVSIPTRRGTYEEFARYKQRVETAGLHVANIGNANVHNMPEVTLNLPGRDQKIEEYKQYLRDLAKAGIFYTTYAHMGNGIWS